LLFVFAVTGLLWALSIVSSFNKRTFWKYLLINSLVFTVYSYLWIHYSEIVTGNDTYGFGKMYGYIIIIIGHSFLGFIILRLRTDSVKRNTWTNIIITHTTRIILLDLVNGGFVSYYILMYYRGIGLPRLNGLVKTAILQPFRNLSLTCGQTRR
jgi:hypothetical protein